MKTSIFFLSFFTVATFFATNGLAQYGRIYDVAGGGSHTGYGIDGYGDGCRADSAVFITPQGICVDKNQNLYIVDRNHFIIRKVNALTGIITVIGGNGTQGYSGDGGSALLAKIAYPTSVCVDTAGNVYFTDTYNNRIRMISKATGVISTVVGSSTGGFSGDGGPAITASIYGPSGLYVDVAGNIYFIHGGDRIRKVTKSTGMINTIAGNGTSGFSGDGGPATSATIYFASALVGDKYGNIYFTDQYNQRIRKINTSGIISTIAGTGTIGYTNGGMPAINASLSYPQGIGIDTFGNVYFSEQSNYIIRKVDVSTGILTTVAGTTVNPSSGGNLWTTGRSSDSSYLYAEFICLDQTGNIYYSYKYDEIRKVVAPASAIATLYVTDSLVTAPCSMPKTVAVGIHGTINGTPSSTDSMRITINFGEFGTNSTKTFVLPYKGSTVYSFGDTFNKLCTYTYSIPGIYNPTITIHTLGGFADVSSLPTIIAGSICDSSITGIVIDSVKDSIISAVCVVPATVKYKVWGRVFGTPVVGDSIYLVYKYKDNDTLSNIHVVPISVSGSGYYFNDSIYAILYAGSYNSQIMAISSSGRKNTTSSFPAFNINTCTSGNSRITALINDSVTNTNPCDLPYLLGYDVWGDLFDYADTNSSVMVYLNYGDGMTSSFSVPVISDGHGNFSYHRSILHAYSTRGVYTFKDSARAGIYKATTKAKTLTVAGTSGIDMSTNGWSFDLVRNDTGYIGIWVSTKSGYLCDSITSAITLTIDSHLTYVGTKDGPAPTSISGNTLTWSSKFISNPFKLYSTIKVVCDGSASIGDTLCNIVHVASSFPDPDTTNNTYSFCQIVHATPNANEKQVSPVGKGSQGYITNGTPLNYTIHFQNTTSSVAKNVVITDTLTRLQINTVSILSSSFPVTLSEVNSRVIKFTFNNINLPNSVDSPFESTGYVSFNVMPNDSLANNTQIKNKAVIYFDSAPPVSTNTTLNTITKPSPTGVTIANNGVDGIQVYPNPTKNNLQLRISNWQQGEDHSYTITDLVGRRVSQGEILSSNQLIDVQELKAGMYFIQLGGYVQKFVKE